MCYSTQKQIQKIPTPGIAVGERGRERGERND